MKMPLKLLSILLVNFSGSLGFSFVIPFLVILSDRFGGNAFTYGLLGSIYPFFQFVAAPYLGKLSDHYGRRPILLFSQAGTLIGWIVFFIALVLPVTTLAKIDAPVIGSFTLTLPLLTLFIARALDGITGSDISVAQAYTADISNDSNRSANFGKLQVSSNLGFILGPALAGVLASTALKEQVPVMGAIIISAIAILLVLFFVPESHKKTNEDNQEKSSLRELLQDKDIVYLLIIYFIMYIGFNIFYTAFPVHATTTMAWTVGKMGMYFSFLSLLMAVVQGPILSFVAKRFSDITLAIVGTAILGLNFILLTQNVEILMYLAAVLFAVGNGLMWPSFLSIVAKIAGKQQGAVQGLTASASALASIIGLIAGGFLYGVLKFNTFYVAAAFILTVFILLLRLPSMLRVRK